MKLLLACSGGFSSSLLVKRILEAGEKTGFKVECKAVSIGEAIEDNANWDIVMLGPQVKYLANDLRKVSKVPVLDIVPKDYGTGNGLNVLNMARKELEV